MKIGQWLETEYGTEFRFNAPRVIDGREVEAILITEGVLQSLPSGCTPEDLVCSMLDPDLQGQDEGDGLRSAALHIAPEEPGADG